MSLTNIPMRVLFWHEGATYEIEGQYIYTDVSNVIGCSEDHEPLKEDGFSIDAARVNWEPLEPKDTWILYACEPWRRALFNALVEKLL